MNTQPEALSIARYLEDGYCQDCGGDISWPQAADEIRRLHSVNAELLALVRRYRSETPLGHQPHMIAHEADSAIARAEGGQP